MPSAILTFIIWAELSAKGYKRIILDHLAKNPDRWYKMHELQSVHLDGKWVGTRGGRDCRDLASNHAVDIRYVGDKRRYVEYKHKEATTGQISAIDTMPKVDDTLQETQNAYYDESMQLKMI